jgi:hypothetical protein
MPGKFLFYFNDTVSREKQNTHLQRLKDYWMALSNQSELTVFFSPRQVNLKNQPPHFSKPNNSGR